MNYMNLGIKSRKTGIRVKENIRKDEFSMENIDDFFGDDSSIQGKISRKSSLLPQFNQKIPEVIFEENIEENDPNDIKLTHHKGSDNQRSRDERSNSFTNSSIQGTKEDDYIPHNNDDFYEDLVSENYRKRPELPATKSPTRRKYFLEYNTTNDDHDPVQLTPPSAEGDSYKDVPDLVDDDDLSRVNTTLNTSDNALLEDELDDDYELQSEEDADYVEGMSTLDGDNSSESDNESYSSDASEVSSDKIAHRQVENRAQNKSRNKYLADSSSDLESDEEFIQSQAPDVVNEDSILKSNGIRKSTRVKIAPLEYWRNERIVYKRKSKKPVLEIDKVITYENDDGETESLRSKKPKQRTRPYNYIPTGRPRGRPRKNLSLSVDKRSDPNHKLLDEIHAGRVQNSQWLQHGVLQAEVNVAPHTKEEEIIAFARDTSNTQHHRNNEEESFSIAVLFDKRKSKFASGILNLPKGGHNKVSDSYNVFFNFYLIEGIIEVTIGTSSFVCVEGCSFQIPVYNKYRIENKGESEAKMYFVQVTMQEDGADNSIDDGSIKTREKTVASGDRSTSSDDMETSAN